MKDKKKKNRFITVFYLFVIFGTLAVIIILAFRGSVENKVVLKPQEMAIQGLYGMDILKTDILNVEIVDEMPPIKERSNGFAGNNLCKGEFVLEDDSKCKLFVNRGIPIFVRITCKNDVLYINTKDSVETQNLYQSICNWKSQDN